MSVWTSGLIRAMVIAALGSGFQHGYHTGVTNIPQTILKSWIKTILSDRHGTPPSETSLMLKWSATVAIYAMGGIVGGSLTCLLADRYGRRRSLMWNNLLQMTGALISIGSKQAHSFEMLMIGRFVCGINAGLNGGLCQIYLTEIAPCNIRGAVGGFYQLIITTSILISQIAGWLLGSEKHWPFIFVIPLIPAVMQIMALRFCPDSPIYLLVFKGDENGTEQSLIRLRGNNDVREELDAMIEDDNLIKELRIVTLKRLCTNAALRGKLLVCVTIMMGQQLCGINVVIYYSIHSLQENGVDAFDAFCVTLALSIVTISATVVGLCLIDLLGRRKLLLFGFFGMALTTAGLILILLFSHRKNLSLYASIFFIFSFMIFFAPGIGTIPWFYTAEVFYPTVNSLAVSIAVSVNWFANVIVAQTFLPLIAVIHYYVGIIFIILDVFFLIYVYIYLPETAKKTMNDIIKFYR